MNQMVIAQTQTQPKSKAQSKPLERPVSAVELAEIFGLSKQFFLNNKDTMKIPHLKISQRNVRFYVSEVTQWFEQRRAI